MVKIEIRCDWCGKAIRRYPCQMKAHNFCSRGCLAAFSSKDKNPGGYSDLKDYTNISAHCTDMNLTLNSKRMTPEIREKLRYARLGTGEGRTYTKVYGRHEHRMIAEQILGRPLKPGEVVHHIDGDKRNNDPENLMVTKNQAEHARLHARLAAFFAQTGGDLK